MADNDIFRKVALDRLSSPEQLDQSMDITNSRAWMSLFAIGGLMLMTIVWGFMGALPTTVHGTGILIRTEGLGDVAATASGQISHVYVDRGDHIKAGQVVARLAQTQLAEEVSAAGARLEELRAGHAQLQEFGEEGQKIQSDVLSQKAMRLRIQLRASKERRSWLKSRVDSRRRLHEQGLITKAELQTTIMESQNAQQNVQDLTGQLSQIKLERLDSSKRTDTEKRSSQFDIREAERRLTFLEEKLRLNSEVVSAHAGRVMEVRAASGDFLTAGTAVLSIELMDGELQPLEAMIYIPSSQGKLVQPGMEARIAPSVVRPEEHGMVMGEVTTVAEFSSTQRGMMRVLDNQELVGSLLRATDGAPLAVKAQLISDESTASGYQWTSSTGPDLTLTSGTPCNVAITVKVQRPITLVIPALRRWLGL